MKLHRLVVSALCAGFACPLAIAQCVSGWQPGMPIPGVDGRVTAMTTWDSDGPGPLPARLVLGGDFSVAGNVVTDGVALYDPATSQWSALPSLGVQGDRYVQSLVALPNGDLVVGMGGPTQPWDKLALQWNGTTWSTMAFGSGWIQAMLVMPNGDLIAGGALNVLSGMTPTPMRLARWNGATWVPFAGDVLGSGGSVVYDLALTAVGALIATGSFTSAGGVAVDNIAAWDGVTWSPLGSGLDAVGSKLCVRQNGDLVVAGAFLTAGSVPAAGLALWNGGVWSAIGSPNPGGTVDALANDPASGALLAGGFFTSIGGVPCNRIASWNGSTWSAPTTGVDGQVASLCVLANGHLAAGGYFTTAGGAPALGFGVWNGSQWLGLGTLPMGHVWAVVALPNGDALAAGSTPLGQPLLVRQSGGVWQPFGTGLDGVVNALHRLANGDIVAGGWFTTIGGTAASRIARWNGSTWSPLGFGCNGPVSAIASDANGQIFVAGSFSMAGSALVNGIARWNGTAWSPLGAGVAGGVISELAFLPSGELVAAGSSLNIGGAITSVAGWNGSVWSAFGTGLLGYVYDLAVTPQGRLFVSGNFLPNFNQALVLWNGTAWTFVPTLGAAHGNAMAALPDDNLLLAGAGTLGHGPYYVLRIDGTTATYLDTTDNLVYALSYDGNGSVLAGGEFAILGSAASPRFGRYTTSCQATATSLGGGCPSSGGSNTLVATSLPWTGGTLSTRGTGLPSNALVAVVRGFSAAAIPLAQILPQGQPGCTLLSSVDALDLTTATNGVATASMTIPNTMALAGVTFREQWVPFELAPGPTIVAVTSTNALLLLLGTL